MKSKFKIDESVKFEVNGSQKKWTVNIIDHFMGKYEYDILVFGENVQYKHLPESCLEKLTK